MKKLILIIMAVLLLGCNKEENELPEIVGEADIVLDGKITYHIYYIENAYIHRVEYGPMDKRLISSGCFIKNEDGKLVSFGQISGVSRYEILRLENK